MFIRQLLYGPRFIKQFNLLPLRIKNISIKKVEIFKTNPIHPSLRLHSLNGFNNVYSISINMNYRIIFERKNNGDIIFISAGKHDIYKNL